MAFSFLPPINEDPLNPTGCSMGVVGDRLSRGSRCARGGMRKRKPSKLDRFIEEFKIELDFFDFGRQIPSWVFDYRDDHIRKISSKQMVMYRYLKDKGIEFKIKWPVYIDGKWKFADVYIPSRKMVIIFSTPISNHRPAGLLSYRAEFFADRYKVVEVEDLAELKRRGF